MKTTKANINWNEDQNKYEITQSVILNKKEWAQFLKNAAELSERDQSFQTQQGTCRFNADTKTIFVYADSATWDLSTKDRKESEAWSWLATVKDDIKSYIQ